MKVGDEVTKVAFLEAEQQDTSQTRRKEKQIDRPFELNKENKGWTLVHHVLQLLKPEERVKLTFTRNGQSNNVVLAPVASEDWFYPDRGLNLQSASGRRTADDFQEAFALGVRETREALFQIVVVLRNIKDSFRSLGGPGTIAVVATMEASEGFARLLIFLTLLSANLAIINFLPIPVLDGGHMMFLVYEGVFGKPVNERLAFGLTLLGLSFVLGLMVFVIGLDVYRFTRLAG